MMKRIIAPVAAAVLASGVAYAQTAPSGAAGEKSPTAESSTEAQQSAAPGAATTAMPSEMTSEKLLDMKVVSPQGENIGEVEQMVIDPKSGQISSLVVSVGGFLGIGDKKVAMPWDQFQMGQEDQLVAQATKQELEQAQAWEDPDQQQAETREQPQRPGETSAPSTAPGANAPSSVTPPSSGAGDSR